MLFDVSHGTNNRSYFWVEAGRVKLFGEFGGIFDESVKLSCVYSDQG